MVNALLKISDLFNSSKTKDDFDRVDSNRIKNY